MNQRVSRACSEIQRARKAKRHSSNAKTWSDASQDIETHRKVMFFKLQLILLTDWFKLSVQKLPSGSAGSRISPELNNVNHWCVWGPKSIYDYIKTHLFSFSHTCKLTTQSCESLGWRVITFPAKQTPKNENYEKKT